MLIMLQVSLRTVAMMVPDMKRIIEVWLLCNGFSDVGVLVEKISFFIKVIREEVKITFFTILNCIVNLVPRLLSLFVSCTGVQLMLKSHPSEPIRLQHLGLITEWYIINELIVLLSVNQYVVILL